jgi:Chaperone of endosialidase
MAGWVAAATIGSSLIGGVLSGNAAQDAANTQAQAGAASQAALLGVGKDVSKLYQPYQDVGAQGLNKLSDMSKSGYLTNQFSNADLNAQMSPNYAFQLGQGQQANLAQANATGGLVGGNAMKGLQDYTQNYAGNAYQNAFNNYQAQRTNIYNQNAGLAGIGQNAVTGSGNAQLGIGTQISNITQGIANAQAAGTIGAANAYSGAIGGMGSGAALYGLLGNQNNLTGLQNTISNENLYNPSDRRLKTNIVKIGQYLNGLNKYSWTYLWGENSTGAMADEVEKLIPEAVKVFNGYKHVNYALLGE